MNYAIEFQHTTFAYLHVTPRKKTLKHTLLSIIQGLAIIKLGKSEYAIEAGQSFWIPQDCLVTITYLPNTRIHTCDFSIRLHDRFPTKTGYIQPAPLLKSAMDALPNIKSNTAYQTDVLAVVKHEVLTLKPQLKPNKLSTEISQWQHSRRFNHDSTSMRELQLILLVREARKRKLSGMKPNVIIDELFAGNEAQYQQCCQLILGDIL